MTTRVKTTKRLARYRPYPKYKDSGVEWLGEIPAHWTIDRFKRAVTGCQNGLWGDEPDGLNDIACVRVADFDRISLRVDLSRPTFRSVEQHVRNARLLKAGDLLLEKSGGGEKQPVGAVMIYDHSEPAVCSNFIARMPVAPGFNARHLVYLHSAAYAARLNKCCIKQNTGIQNLDSGAYLAKYVAIPTLLEQVTIAAFLDSETAKTDNLIKKKRHLIELLQEKRTALITHAVTKGLDPDGSMKDSGVEWLGEIPAHWKIVRLKYVAPLQGGYAFKSEIFQGDGVAVVRMTNLRRGMLDLREAARIASGDCLNSFSLKADDLLLGMSGSLGETGSLGNYAIVRPEDLPSQLNQRVGRFQLSERLKGNFLSFFIAAAPFTEPLLADSTGTAQFNISPEGVGSVTLGLPPIEEQEVISDFLMTEAAKVGSLIARVRLAIDHLKEYRTALISAAVTGKIDVRKAITGEET